jgi:hypothetical protein
LPATRGLRGSHARLGRRGAGGGVVLSLVDRTVNATSDAARTLARPGQGVSTPSRMPPAAQGQMQTAAQSHPAASAFTASHHEELIAASPVGYRLDSAAACRHRGFARPRRQSRQQRRPIRRSPLPLRRRPNRLRQCKRRPPRSATPYRGTRRPVGRSRFSRANTTTAPRADIVKAAGDYCSDRY